MKRIEELIVSHTCRGMEILRPYLPEYFCRDAAEEILHWPKGTVLLTTGFYVNGYGENDGPCGTMCIATALRMLGFQCVIVTDQFCQDYFEQEQFEVVYLDVAADKQVCQQLLNQYQPVGMIAVERCGRNPSGDYINIRNSSIRSFVAPADWLFILGEGRIPTIGIGDGGNEIGMGNLADVITEQGAVVPCCGRADHLIIAAVSNWGAFGLTAYLELLSGQAVMPTYEQISHYYQMGYQLGHVDGTTQKRDPDTVDGFDRLLERELVEALYAAIQSR